MATPLTKTLLSTLALALCGLAQVLISTQS